MEYFSASLGHLKSESCESAERLQPASCGVLVHLRGFLTSVPALALRVLGKVSWKLTAKVLSSTASGKCRHDKLRNIISSFAWISQFTALAVSDCQVRMGFAGLHCDRAGVVVHFAFR